MPTSKKPLSSTIHQSLPPTLCRLGAGLGSSLLWLAKTPLVQDRNTQAQTAESRHTRLACRAIRSCYENGRLERLIRRMLAESNAEPIHVHDVLVRAYPNVRPLHRALA